ncbi:hypothetical protein LIER_09545 [Lithospermum erythrorhizon]|uniref:Uncharacterized protein n=1 Tax=Lithospermum erythrorhizon TaxID=34254 RepID=A0AAV3PHC4_LITER
MLLAKPQVVLHEILLLGLEEDVDQLTLNKLALYFRQLFLQRCCSPRRDLSLKILILLFKAIHPPRKLEASICGLRINKNNKGKIKVKDGVRGRIPKSYAYTLLHRPLEG